jgi:DNA-binding NarL/FixJ family response regulator
MDDSRGRQLTGGSGSARRTRVVLADPHPLVVEALAARIASEPDLELVEGLDGRAALEQEITRLAPDVALVAFDLWSPPPALLPPDTLRAIAGRTRLILIYDNISSHEVWQAIRAGALGVISRGAVATDFIQAVRDALDGRSHLDSNAQRELAEYIRAQGDRGGALTRREREVLSLSADGLTTKQIGARLGLSASSIKASLRSVYMKLDVHDRPAAVAQALRRGLIS